MVTLIGPLPFHEEINIKCLISSGRKCNNKRCTKHGLKYKHHSKCRKYYKYRLQQNGDDPDVTEVSHILLSTLKIKSPTKLLLSPNKFDNTEELRPPNYLFKMARRKQKLQPEPSEVSVKNDTKAVTSVSPGTQTQQKKKTDAFKLLMDSRNKSIGSNSPGKEKDIDVTEMQEIIEKKTIKVKRNLALQKMAEAKGASKKKELDELEEKCIKRKMENRAERLKNMMKLQEKQKKSKEASKKLNNVTSKSSSKPVQETIKIEDESNNTNKVVEHDESQSKPTKSLELVDIFKDVINPKNISPKKKPLTKEDKEFLDKLSPSLKKKENMMCYFKKIEKLSPSKDSKESTDKIKVKLSHKHKKKLKRNRLSLAKNISSDVLKDHNENDSCKNDLETKVPSVVIQTAEIKENSHKERKKRKRCENYNKVEEITETNNAKNLVEPKIENERGRPKRTVKKPIKYIEDEQLSSSDDDLHIFTPIKRKRQDKTTHVDKELSKHIVISDEESNSKKKKVKIVDKNVEHDEKSKRKTAKLAPIFTPKPQLNTEELEAKQKFLYSGVPDQIKKIISQQKNLQTIITNDFPLVVHVQQKDRIETEASLTPLLVLDFTSDEDSYDNETRGFEFSNFVKPDETDNYVVPTLKSNATLVLQTIKEQYPKFPAHRIYRLLKTKSKGEFKEDSKLELDNSSEIINNIGDATNENPEYLSWTDKYKATSTKHLIGNFDGIKELKRWLLSWTELETKLKSKKGSDSSDFYDSDSNSRDSFKNNLLIVAGPVGSGKTSSIYAVATELSIKVIEVNASSKRTGKVMLQDLQEATQSHKINRGSDNSQKSQEIVETVVLTKKRGRPKKSDLLRKAPSKDDMVSQSQPQASQANKTVMSLILVDDTDIVFDQDDGFLSAIAQLIQCSKRPVILVTSSLTCPHLQRFLQYGKIINMHPLSPRMLGTWLDVMCLADGHCWPGLGAKFLDYFKGDIRKSINSLQFYISSYSQEYPKDDAMSDIKSLDEDSNISWPDSEGIEEKALSQSVADTKAIIWKHLMDKEVNLLYLRYPKHLFWIWWNVPSLFAEVFENNCNDGNKEIEKEVLNDKTVSELETVAKFMDTLSLSDYYSSRNPDTSCNIASNPWYTSETDGVSELECLDSYNNHHEVTSAILGELLASSTIEAQKTLKCEKRTTIDFPSMATQRERARIISRHDSLANCVNPTAVLDRKGLALDYWSNCRAICRIESNKTDTVSKRNNRFCHYLKSLNVTCGSDTFDSLGNSLSFKGNVE